MIPHGYYGTNTCVSFCEIKPRCHYNDNRGISPKVLSMKLQEKVMRYVMLLAMCRVLVQE